MKKKIEDLYESTAKVVDGNLIISLPDAVNPIVWRMDLSSVKASALEVRQPQADGLHILTLKTPKGESHDIAPFASRDLAVRALMRVSAALQGAQGHMTTSTAPTTPTGLAANTSMPPESAGLKWLVALGCVLALIFVFSYIGRMAPSPSSSTAPMADMATTTGGTPSATSGVPQSADDLLGGGVN